MLYFIYEYIYNKLSYISVISINIIQQNNIVCV